MTQKLKNLSFLLVTVPFLHIESSVIPPLKAFYEGLHFFFLHWWAMNNIRRHYDLKAWKFADLTVLCAVWFTLFVLRDLFLKPWADQHLLTFKVNIRSNWNLLTVACNSSILVKRFQYIGIFYCFSNFGTILIILFFFRTDDCSRKSPKPHHIQPPNSTHIWTLIRRCA